MAGSAERGLLADPSLHIAGGLCWLAASVFDMFMLLLACSPSGWGLSGQPVGKKLHDWAAGLEKAL